MAQMFMGRLTLPLQTSSKPEGTAFFCLLAGFWTPRQQGWHHSCTEKPIATCSWLPPGDFYVVPFVVMICFHIRDYNILPKKESHRSLQVEF